jgi:hypothetical protein
MKWSAIVLVALVAVVAPVLFAGVVDAGCIPCGSGCRYCAAWITGSEICRVSIQGSVERDVPVVLCEVSNATGLSFCLNPDSRTPQAQGRPYHLEQLVSIQQDPIVCTKNGSKCVSEIELDPTVAEFPDLCINPNWEFITFTAQSFTAKVTVCPDGFQSDGAGGFFCPGTPLNAGFSLTETCTVSLDDYKPGTTKNYNCVQQFP